MGNILLEELSVDSDSPDVIAQSHDFVRILIWPGFYRSEGQYQNGNATLGVRASGRGAVPLHSGAGTLRTEQGLSPHRSPGLRMRVRL